MRRLCLLLLGLVIASASAAQDDVMDDAPPVRWPAVAASARDAAGFAPRGWTVEASATGDISGDGVPDLVAVLHDRARANVIRRPGDTGTLDTNPRLLVVATGQRGGPYRLLAANHVLIPRWTEWNLDDPLGDTSRFAIRRGAFGVPLHMFANAGGWGASDRMLTFRVVGGQVTLIGFEEQYLRRNTGQTTTTSVNYLTRTKRVTRDSIDGDAPVSTRQTRLPPGPLLTLDKVGDGMEFEPK